MKPKTSQEISAPRSGSKQAKLVAMLSRKTGITIDEASTAFGWQTHTTRAALTGLKKRGYIIERVDRDNKASIYIIRSRDDDAV
jgi:predicted ArsR family transcriptional regulator